MGLFEKTWKLNFTQCYPNGQLKYSELNNLLQITASEHAEIIGLGYRLMFKTSQSFVLSRMRIEVDELPKYTQDIIIKTWIQDFNGSKSIRNFEVSYQGKILVRASSLWVVFNIKERKADQLILNTDHILLFPDKTSTNLPVTKIEGNLDYRELSDYTVKLSDMDIVNHANNVKYMDWCFDAMNPKEILNGNIKSIDMNYLKELKYADEVTISESINTNNNSTYKIEKEGRSHFLMLLNRI